MKLIVELEPTRNREKLERFIGMLASMPCVWRVAVPDAPLGRPKASALLLASVLENAGIPSIVHMRLRDYNRLAFEQMVWGAYLAGIRYILFLRGDPPAVGRDVNEVSSEEAVRYVKSNDRLRDLKVGVYISLRFNESDIIRRVEATRADFYVMNRFDPSLEKHGAIASLIKRISGGSVYAYLITAPQRELRSLSERLSGQTVYALEKLPEILEAYRDRGLDAALVSAPGHFQDLLEVLRPMCRG